LSNTALILGLKAINAFDVLTEVAKQLEMGVDDLIDDLEAMRQGNLSAEKFVAKHKSLRDLSTQEL